jgi:hypothetical protein
MGHPDNITTDTFKSLGKKVGKKEPETRQWVFDYLESQMNDPESPKDSLIEEMFTKASKAWGQSIEQSKKQTFSMLKSET